jgi:hypothetical protein
MRVFFVVKVSVCEFSPQYIKARILHMLLPTYSEGVPKNSLYLRKTPADNLL